MQQKTVNASAAKAGEANTWEATFEAPKYNAAGEEIVYTVTEVSNCWLYSKGKRKPERWLHNYQ